jgi:hypothetical protein
MSNVASYANERRQAALVIGKSKRSRWDRFGFASSGNPFACHKLRNCSMDFPIPFVDMNDGVSVREKSFATWLEALDHYDTFRTQESFPDMARRPVKSCLLKYGVHDSREGRVQANDTAQGFVQRMRAASSFDGDVLLHRQSRFLFPES